MKVDFNKTMKDIYGEEVTDAGKPVKFKTPVVNSLLQGEDNMTGEQKVKAKRLAEKIALSDDEIDIDVKEAAQIDKLVDKHFGVLVYALVYELINGEENGSDES